MHGDVNLEFQRVYRVQSYRTCVHRPGLARHRAPTTHHRSRVPPPPIVASHHHPSPQPRPTRRLSFPGTVQPVSSRAGDASRAPCAARRDVGTSGESGSRDLITRSFHTIPGAPLCAPIPSGGLRGSPRVCHTLCLLMHSSPGQVCGPTW